MLWFDEVVEALDGAEAAGAVDEELTPLEVLTELCWMASFWGLPGTDISSQLSSLSETVREDEKITDETARSIIMFGFRHIAVYLQHLTDIIQKGLGKPCHVGLIRCKTAICMWCMQTVSLIPIMLLLHPFL